LNAALDRVDAALSGALLVCREEIAKLENTGIAEYLQDVASCIGDGREEIATIREDLEKQAAGIPPEEW